jgi:hypothetical protein
LFYKYKILIKRKGGCECHARASKWTSLVSFRTTHMASYDDETLPYMEALEAYRRSFPGGTTCVRWRDSLTTVNFFPLLPFFSLFSYQSVREFSHLFFISSLVLIFFIVIFFYIFFWLIFYSITSLIIWFYFIFISNLVLIFFIFLKLLLIEFCFQFHPSTFDFNLFLCQIWSSFFLLLYFLFVLDPFFIAFKKKHCIPKHCFY